MPWQRQRHHGSSWQISHAQLDLVIERQPVSREEAVAQVLCKRPRRDDIRAERVQ
jgi:hypothetical protein